MNETSPDSVTVSTKLVKNGVDTQLQKGKHNLINVYSAMLLQVALYYNCLPDLRSLSCDEIDFFYEGIRQQLKEDTKPRGKNG